MRILAAVAAIAAFAGVAHAQYNPAAGQNAPMDKVERSYRDTNGVMRTETLEVAPMQDQYGNAQGNSHDLAVDGAFEGQTVAVLQLYDFDFSLARAALKEKGFGVYRWSGVPAPDVLRAGLEKASQLWVISGSAQMLTPEHVAIIQRYWQEGHGVYIWGDNEPYYADANVLAQALFGTTMQGNLQGDEVVGVEPRPGTPGLLPNHLLTTGLAHIYEGITIATIQPSRDLHPLIYGSADNLVAAYYDQDGRRAILDGGFTRLYNKWDTAGTARYVKNAASWLVNAERFGDAVVAVKARTTASPRSIPTPSQPVAAPAVADSGWLPTDRLGWLLVSGLGLLLALGIYVNTRSPANSRYS